MTHLANAQAPGLFRRLAAMLYETLLLAAVVIVAAFVYTVLVQRLTGADLTQGLARLAFQVYLLMVMLGYFLYFWSQGRQSLAMRTWRMLILNEDGTPLRCLDALRRLAFALITLAPLGFGLWWTLFDKDQQTWYDRLARTRTLLTKAKQTGNRSDTPADDQSSDPGDPPKKATH
jgi:uncharacterized RDD family membrane protein YckC